MERSNYKAFERGILSSKGQITIPKSIRSRLNLSEGDHFEFKVQGDEIVLKKVSLIDEMEDLIIADLKKAGYGDKELQEKLLQQKEKLDRAFERFLAEARQEEKIPLEKSEVFRGLRRKEQNFEK